jgi:hypothetical protein
MCLHFVIVEVSKLEIQQQKKLEIQQRKSWIFCVAPSSTRCSPPAFMAPSQSNT